MPFISLILIKISPISVCARKIYSWAHAIAIGCKSKDINWLEIYGKTLLWWFSTQFCGCKVENYEPCGVCECRKFDSSKLALWIKVTK